MHTFVMDVRTALFGVVVLANAWWLVHKTREQRLHRRRQGVPHEQQLAELRAEVATALVPGAERHSVPTAKYPALTIEHAVEAAGAAGPWRVRESGPKGALRWDFQRTGSAV
ncbi:hypothetical protein OG455_39450 [Kitasatospora sp. NBC_01287]|uniref:hypothetical protein n=1 Tax=Kitasatospora sp. NBC_01287 TaxID=2903573 RepID=UPI00225763B0|nr:hypothetical protein [Kitasatospora sp. NBC_01287]MCX4751513.1 hypothetical protein [Kitasatospora sp. NBC_01287]